MFSCCVFSRVCLCLVFLFVRERPPLWRGFVTDFWCQEWDGSLTVCIDNSKGDTQANNKCFTMAARASDYDSWSLQDLRDEASKRSIYFSSKDGVRTLASKLRVFDRLGQSLGDAQENLAEEALGTSLSFEQRLQLQERELQMLELRKKISQEHREIRELERELERERREAERVAERERREYERVKAQEEEERKAREEERILKLQAEKEEIGVRGLERQQSEVKRPKFIKIREMREGEDIDDYFRIFEMTAKAQSLPEGEWVGNLVPKLTEKAKSIYLEIPDPACQDYNESKAIIIKAYQLTADHYRYRFRTSEKKPDEDFVQWGNRTRRYLNRWMAVAEATGDAEKIIEQIMIERLLDAVSPELRAWLKEQKPKSAEELGNLANLHVQSRKGPLVGGKYVSTSERFGKKKKSDNKADDSLSEEKQEQNSERPPKSPSLPTRKNTRPEIKCYKCGKLGHMSFNCGRGRGKSSQAYLLCMTPLASEQSEISPFCVRGKINGKSAEMVVDSGCTRTLIHKRYVNDSAFTGDKFTVLTATGERLSVPIANVEFVSKEGKHVELVGVLDTLPVDCLLGRSSFGKTLSKQDILDQWEKNLSVEDDSGHDAFVMTRRQRALEDAQTRADELIDRESSLAVKSLSKKEAKSDAPEIGDLRLLFEGNIHDDIGKDSESNAQVKESFKDNPPPNILDRNRNQLILDQKSDVTLEKSCSVATEMAPKESDGYFFTSGVLMHRKYLTNERNGTRYVDRIVVPESYRNEILRIGHTIPLSGHMARKKTVERITAHFFWPGLHFDVRKYCATCPQCQVVARKLKSSRAPLKPVDIVTEPFKKIAIDIVGELPRTTTGYKYILTIVDYATRYPEAIPLRSTNSKTIADALIQYFSRVGIPDEIVSDQGSNFMSKLMAQLYDQLGITKIKTSVYHPEANGLVERFNGTLKGMLKKFVQERVQTWDKYLPYLLFAYREVPSESTGYSPFELLYGRTVRGPLAVIKETWLETKSSEDNLVTHVLEIRRRLATMQRVVQENLKKAQGKQKQLYDTHSSKRRLEVGDKALVLLPTPGSKLEMKWQGPFTVTKALEDGLNYELDTGKTNKQHRIYHINLLSKWQSRDERAALVMEESPEMVLPHENNVPAFGHEETWEDVVISDDLTESQRRQVKELLHEFSDIFSGEPNLTSVATHKIDTGDSPPIRSSPYRIPQKLEEEVNKEIEKMLEMGIIRPSTSPWAAPVVIVPKPDGTIRLCVDYRKLNSVTKMDAYPIPSMEKMIEKIASAKYISTIDLTKGYWQIPLETSTIEKSAFITMNGLYEFLVMPFGMKTAPASFQRMMSETVLNGLDFADAYIDDVEVDTATSFPQHICELKQVLERLRECKLNARPSKCKLAMSTVDFVGHRVGGDRIQPREALVRTIIEYPRPQTKKQVRSFLGLVGYYRKFIPSFSDRAAVLTDLTKKKSPSNVQWSTNHELAFQDLKGVMQNPPVLRPPHWGEEFILQVDASNRGLGAILSQKDQNGEEHPIAYASRKLQPREQKLSTTEKECLGIVWAVELFRYYLFGRTFKLQTDHNPLVWLNQVRDKSRKLLRWSITLQEYDMKVEHKSGKQNCNVDALSRA